MTEQSISLLGYSIFIGEERTFRGEVKGIVNTINPHCYIVARKDQEYKASLYSSDYLLPDGIGILIASRILKGIKIRKIAGSDLHRIIIKYLAEQNGSCFYLGSSDDTLSRIRSRLMKEHPGIVAGTFSPPYKPSFSEEENAEMIAKINDFNPDVLFVGMTAPKQEKWVYQNRGKINAPLICSIGAVFDFYAGTVKRPGQFWIRLGLEWLPRLLREPGRLWRRNFISNPLFLYYVFAEKFRLIAATFRAEKQS